VPSIKQTGRLLNALPFYHSLTIKLCEVCRKQL